MNVVVPIISALGVVLAAAIAALVQLILGLRKRPEELEERLSEVRRDLESYYPRLRDCEARCRDLELKLYEANRRLAKLGEADDRYAP